MCFTMSSKRSNLNWSELMHFKCQWSGWLLYFCVDMPVYMRGKLEADGGRVNDMLWVLEEEEGR